MHRFSQYKAVQLIQSLKATRIFYLNEFILPTNEIIVFLQHASKMIKRVLGRQYGGVSTAINSFPILRYIETNNRIRLSEN